MKKSLPIAVIYVPRDHMARNEMPVVIAGWREQFKERYEILVLPTKNDDPRVEIAEQGKNYWQKRCEAAEKFIELHPDDPDQNPEQWAAYCEWKSFLPDIRVEMTKAGPAITQS